MTTVVTSMRFACRRRTAADWTSGNEVLLAGEIGYETDTDKFKIGDGVTAWNSIVGYFSKTGGGGGSAAWGGITGTLTDQTDLATALSGKVPTSRTVNGLSLSSNITLSASDVGADASGAAAAAQAYAVQRANHTGTQAQSTITNLTTDLAAKADLVGGVIPTAQIPAYAVTEFLGTVASQVAMLALTGQKGDWCIRSDTGVSWLITGDDPTLLANWTALSYPAAPVQSVNGYTGTVTLAKGDIGLGSVENTALSTWAGSAALTTLGTIATGVWQGTAVGVSYGGTGATTAPNARTALGLAIGSDVQAYDADLAAIAALTPANDDIIQRKSGAWTNRTLAQLASDLGVPTLSANNTWTGQNIFAAGTITASAPATWTQTWNNGAVTFKVLLVNVTDTASGSSSLLADLQVGSSTKFSVDKSGITKLLELQAISGTGILRLGSTAYTDRVGIAGDGVATAMNVGKATICDDSGAAETLALRRSTNAQKFRIYRTFSDASNYERVAIQTGSGYVELAAETAGTGTDDIDLRLTPAGAGKVRFGSHSAIAAETVTGYITITDSGGTSRKIAVVS